MTWDRRFIVSDRIRWANLKTHLNPPDLEVLSRVQPWVLPQQGEGNHIRRQTIGVNGDYLQIPCKQERLLLVATLEQAFKDLNPRQATAPKNKARVRRQVIEWFLSDAIDHAFTFLNICEYLELNPTKIRRDLKLT